MPEKRTIIRWTQVCYKANVNHNSINTDHQILPNFLIAGAAKCGTTSLFHYLKQHPDVFMSPVKEPKFLSGQTSYSDKGSGDHAIEQRGERAYGDYVRLFRKGAGKKMVGEASVDTLFFYESSITAIKRYLGDPRIIIILRDPVERAYSAYNYLVQNGFEKLSFKEALIEEQQDKRLEFRWMGKYREGGMYARPVRAFQENFSRVQVLLYDDLRKDARSVMQSLYTFLNVSPDFVPDMRHRHNATGLPRWTLLDSLFTKPKHLHKVARTVGGALLGSERWIRLRERVRSQILQKPGPIDSDVEQELRRYYREDLMNLQDCIHQDVTAWLGKKIRS